MIISHSRQFILLSPWKTASSTCHETLGSLNEGEYSRFFHWNPKLSRVVHQHMTLADVLALPEGRLGYRLCTFVRNPYDRAYSGFLQIRRDFEKQEPVASFSPSWIGDLVRAQVAENTARIVQAGYDFDRWLQNLPEYEIYEPGRNTNLVLHPAHYWTHVEGAKRVDFVGKVEQFNQDLARLCDYVGVDRPAVVSANISGDGPPREERGYRYTDRMSRRTLDRINALFAADFDYFGYPML